MSKPAIHTKMSEEYVGLFASGSQAVDAADDEMDADDSAMLQVAPAESTRVRRLRQLKAEMELQLHAPAPAPVFLRPSDRDESVSSSSSSSSSSTTTTISAAAALGESGVLRDHLFFSLAPAPAPPASRKRRAERDDQADADETERLRGLCINGTGCTLFRDDETAARLHTESHLRWWRGETVREDGAHDEESGDEESERFTLDRYDVRNHVENALDLRKFKRFSQQHHLYDADLGAGFVCVLSASSVLTASSDN